MQKLTTSTFSKILQVDRQTLHRWKQDKQLMPVETIANRDYYSTDQIEHGRYLKALDAAQPATAMAINISRIIRQELTTKLDERFEQYKQQTEDQLKTTQWSNAYSNLVKNLIAKYDQQTYNDLVTDDLTAGYYLALKDTIETLANNAYDNQLPISKHLLAAAEYLKQTNSIDFNINKLEEKLYR